MQDGAIVHLGSGATWYRVTGDMRACGLPLIVLHGGPGSTHDYLDSFKDLAFAGRAVIQYDQIGNGRSDHAEDRSPGAWTVNVFLRQLKEFIAHLGIGARYALLGHSWGGMLAAEHAVRRPTGLKALVLADAPAAMPLWIAAANRLRRALPPEVLATMLRHECDDTLDDPAYDRAVEVYERRHACRLEPWPPELQRTVAAKKAHPTVFSTMIGRNDCHVTGSLRDWTIVDRCHEIAVPTLLISGHHDAATRATMQPFADRIPDVRWRKFEQASHMPHLEQRPACMDTVGQFLAACDA